ncbi:hypothetical protein R5W23_004569 [Gemmata sp. JC673]|uniref:Uncharacterized protein n=1 Tax=Gemmata algarum TaxID=2975278 RepID=A0ABU5F8L3_9BACT|nr:hypothetical protein [Gemmata algarum]MDY3563070.1 hypothetical protein [Gemmata algarum]
MIRSIVGLGSVLAVLTAGLIVAPRADAAPQKKKPGVLHVYDGAALFTETAIDRGKVALGKTVFDHETVLTVDTHAAVPKDRKLPAEPGERAKFFESWAKSAASGDRAKGVYVLVCRSPGYVQVLADKATRDRGFTAENEQRLRDMFTTAFKDAAAAKKDGKSDEELFKIRDKSLSNAVEYVSGVLKGTIK